MTPDLENTRILHVAACDIHLPWISQPLWLTFPVRLAGDADGKAGTAGRGQPVASVYLQLDGEPWKQDAPRGGAADDCLEVCTTTA